LPGCIARDARSRGGDPRAPRADEDVPADRRRPAADPSEHRLPRRAEPAARARARVTDVDALATAWRGGRSVLVLTGAGPSTASGIPDFRSPGGRWSRYRPVTIQEFLASEDDRARYWRYKGETWDVIQAASPNAAHVALAELGTAGRIALLVTQNVDGLHERSGFPAERLVNIHGSDAAVECVACRRREPRAVAQAIWTSGTAVPRCPCGGPWKP